ncbi:FtsX-like permease family protein [Streptomyces sp. NPDC018000]|uniref:ABC transporter permease n=1 Tax=Streptomyces sp. NPDC018000 TaxID=3365028 RepID=UPI00378EFC9D
MTGAVWRASRAAVKRRRLQTIVIGLVVFCSTTTILLALAVMSAARAPFDAAFGQQRGAHVVATFDTAKAPAERLAATAKGPGIEAAAGPFAQVTLDIPTDWLGNAPGPITLVGRADPAGPVDRVKLLAGRWATQPGEVVVQMGFRGTGWDVLLGRTIAPAGAPPLTVVGVATSLSKSAGGWVTPEQVAALHPVSAQMLYRFTDASNEDRVKADLARATKGLPGDALTSAQSYLTLKQAFSASADSYLPFMSVFGGLGLVVAVLIVGNVVSGAVVSGYRHIGVLKALGFTPRQVVTVYVTMVSVPAVVGSVLGTAVGWVLARPIIDTAFSGVETGTAALDPPLWLPFACLVGVPLLVAVAAFLPASRAHRISAAEAITAGSAPRTGRGLRIQRWLSGTRLPRAVSLGLGQPFARPARTALTMSSIVLGVVTVTFATGLSGTLLASLEPPEADNGRTFVHVQVGSADAHQRVPKLTDAQIEAELRSDPRADQVTSRAFEQAAVVGYTQPVFVDFYGGDAVERPLHVVKGRPATGPGEAIAGPAFLDQHGLKLGDRITLDLGGRLLPLTIVGEPLQGNARSVQSNAATLARLGMKLHVVEYSVRLAPGADADAYIKAIKEADPGLYPNVVTHQAPGPIASVISFSTIFTVLLCVVASLGVFNTVLLNIRERRRDLGMLKSIGMTPRQVVAMTVTSVFGLGVVSGIIGVPVGMVAHRLIIEHIEILVFSESMINVWHAPVLVAVALAGVFIAVLGALLPSRTAAQLPIAEVLHNE